MLIGHFQSLQIQSPQDIPIQNPLTNLPVSSHMEPQYLQPQTGYQQRSTPKPQHFPCHNCDTCRTSVAHSAYHNLQNMAQDWEFTYPVELGEQYTFGADSGDNSCGLLAAIITFLDQKHWRILFHCRHPQAVKHQF